MTGKLVVFEGLDGTGKRTQAKILRKKLSANKKKVCVVSFPRYTSSAGKLVKQFLQGNLCDPVKADAYFSASLFTLDRIMFLQKLKKLLKVGFVVVINRYVYSNVAYQAAKLKQTHWEAFRKWLYKLEFGQMDMPTPDVVVYLRLPLEEVAKVLHLKRKDYYEKQLQYLKRVERVYNWLVKKEKFAVVNGMMNKRRLTPAEVHERVWKIVSAKFEK